MKLNAVLVRTEHSANIGSSARAAANMGADRLILVDPRCELDSEARALAAGAHDMFAAITVYPSWDDFYRTEGEGLRIAMTRREGRARKVSPLAETLDEIASRGTAAALPSNLYLIFGPEQSGLDAADLGFANYICHLPVFGEVASLNLAQAVLLTLFMVRQKFPPLAGIPKQTTGDEEPPYQPLYFPDQLIRDWLTSMGFDIQARRSSAYLTLRRLFMMNQPTKHEYQVLEAILQQNIRKLREGFSRLSGGKADSRPE
jgi:tRNA/rRNA methyltransferase